MDKSVSVSVIMLEGEPLRPEGIPMVTGEEQRTSLSISMRNDMTRSKPQGSLVVDYCSSERKGSCFMKRHTVGTWNVRSMNQGKLEIVKAELVSTQRY